MILLSVCLLVFVLGASLGSFLNVVIYRLPLGESVVFPRSRCPDCHSVIPIWALLPLVGFFLSRAKCCSCKSPISWQYPFVEFLSATITLMLFLWHINIDILLAQTSFHLEYFFSFFISLWILYTGIVLSAIDIKYYILPDKIVLPCLLLGLLSSFWNPELSFLNSFIGAFSVSGFLFAFAFLYKKIRGKEGLGFGDIKYLMFLGSILGTQKTLIALFCASILAAIIGIFLVIFARKNLSYAIPFGPFLVIGGLIASCLRGVM